MCVCVCVCVCVSVYVCVSYARILIRDWCFHETCLMVFDQSWIGSIFIKQHQTCLKCNKIYLTRVKPMTDGQTLFDQTMFDNKD